MHFAIVMRPPSTESAPKTRTGLQSRLWSIELRLWRHRSVQTFTSALRITIQQERVSFISHGRKGFVIPTKSFVKIGITKIFCYNNERFSSINNTFGCCSKVLVEATKNSFAVPNFVAVTKPFFPWAWTRGNECGIKRDTCNRIVEIADNVCLFQLGQ